MSTIANNNGLFFILTEHGLNRIAEALEDPSVEIIMSKMKLGTGHNYNYYIPSSDQTELKGPISGGEFPVLKKELLEDGETVSFMSVFPETFGGYDIREVGLYDTVDGEEHLFAIATQQPMVKPKTVFNYFMTIDYYMFLKAENLADSYDQIVIDPNGALVLEEDLQKLMNTILFTQGNLSVQIGQNSELLGYNRGAQVYSYVESTRDNYGYMAACSSFASFASYVGHDNIFSYCIFNYPKKNQSLEAITDISANGYSLSCSSSLNDLSHGYLGITSSFAFPSPKYFYLNAEVPLFLVNDDTDLSFTMAFIVRPLSTEGDRTLLARSDYALSANCFEIKELSTGQLRVRLFQDSGNYVTFDTPVGSIPITAHSVLICYDGENIEVNVYIDGVKMEVSKTVEGTYTHMNTGAAHIYGFDCRPFYEIYTNSQSTPTVFYNKDGSPYEGSGWTINQNQVYYQQEAATYTDSANIQTDTLYAWCYDDGIEEHIVYTRNTSINRNTVLYNIDYSVYTGNEFKVVPVGSAYIVQYEAYSTHYDFTKNILPKTIYAWRYYEGTVYIWSNSSTSPTILLTQDGSVYPEDEIWGIEDNKIIYKPTGTVATYNSSLDEFVSNLSTTSYIITSDGSATDFINSEVGLVGIALKSMDDESMRLFSLELSAQLGKSPCISAG